jgi:hypothetical protein
MIISHVLKLEANTIRIQTLVQSCTTLTMRSWLPDYHVT